MDMFSGKQILIPIAALLLLAVFNLIADPSFYKISMDVNSAGNHVLSGYLKLTPPENRQAVFDSLNYLTVAPIIEDYSQMSDIITDKLTLAANGEISVQEALDQAQQECTDTISLK